MMLSTLMSYRSLQYVPYISSYQVGIKDFRQWRDTDLDIERSRKNLWKIALFIFFCFEHNHLDMYLWVSKQMHLSSSESWFLCAQMQNCSRSLNSFNASDGPNPFKVAAAKISQVPQELLSISPIRSLFLSKTNILHSRDSALPRLLLITSTNIHIIIYQNML